MQPYRFEAKNTCKFHLNNCSGNFLWKEDTQKSPWKNKVIALQKDFLLLHCFPFASAVCLLWVVQLWFFSVSSSKSTAELLCTEENCYLFLCHKEKNKKQNKKNNNPAVLCTNSLWHDWNWKMTISPECCAEGYSFVSSFRWEGLTMWVVEAQKLLIHGSFLTSDIKIQWHFSMCCKNRCVFVDHLVANWAHFIVGLLYQATKA